MWGEAVAKVYWAGTRGRPAKCGGLQRGHLSKASAQGRESHRTIGGGKVAHGLDDKVVGHRARLEELLQDVQHNLAVGATHGHNDGRGRALPLGHNLLSGVVDVERAW